MAVTNAISAIIIVGAMLAAGLTEGSVGRVMGTLAVALAAVNVFGGFLVTQRMLEMFKKKEPKKLAGKEGHDDRTRQHEPRHAAVPCGVGLLHPGPQGPVPPASARKGNTFGMIGMAIAVVTTLVLIVKLKNEFLAAGTAQSSVGTGLALIFGALVVGGGIGAYVARKVEMTKMPELVAAMHSLIGLAAVFIAVAAVAEPAAFGIAPAGSHLIPPATASSCSSAASWAPSRSRAR